MMRMTWSRVQWVFAVVGHLQVDQEGDQADLMAAEEGLEHLAADQEAYPCRRV